MSLWLDSLESCLSDYDSPPGVERPVLIFAHLAMRTPRSWWEPCLRRGKPRKDDAWILRRLYDELKKHPELQGRINYSLLVAMAFLDDEAQPSFGTLPNQHSIEAYIEGAEKVLADRPDVRRAGEAVTKVANALPSTQFTLSSKRNIEE